MSNKAITPSPEGLEFAQEVLKLDQDTRTQIITIMRLLANSDVRGKEISAMYARGEISMEESIDLWDEYLANRH